jgi:hypothetical protein
MRAELRKSIKGSFATGELCSSPPNAARAINFLTRRFQFEVENFIQESASGTFSTKASERSGAGNVIEKVIAANYFQPLALAHLAALTINFHYRLFARLSLLPSPLVLAPVIVYEKFSIVEWRAPLKARKFLKDTIEVATKTTKLLVERGEEKSSTSFKGLRDGGDKRQKLECSTLARHSRLFLSLTHATVDADNTSE